MSKKKKKHHRASNGKPRKAARAPKSKLATSRKPPDDIIKAAQETERRTGVPTSVTLGQWAIESGYGKHMPGNNPFGIKARKGEPFVLLSTKEQHGSKLVTEKHKFRKFDSLDEAFRARGDLLSKHYPLAMAHKDDPDAFVHGLQADPKHKYATLSTYEKLVTSVMKSNNYYQYDLKNYKEDKSSDAGGGVQIKDGEPTVMLGTKQLMAAHVDSPHDGGGKLIEGSTTVFVGRKLRPFSRKGDVTDDGLAVKNDVQDDILIG